VSRARRRRRFYGATAALAAIIAVALHVTWAPAVPVVGPTPPAHASMTVTTPTDGLTDGSAVHFTIDTSMNPAGGQVTLAVVEARICQTGFTTYSLSSFGFTGSAGVRCVDAQGIQSGGLSGVDDGYHIGPFPFSAVTTSGDLAIHVGTGSVSWLNDDSFPSSLTCDSANPCDVVVHVGLVGDTVADTFFIQTVTFAGGGTTTTTTSPTTTTTSPTTTRTTTTTTTRPPTTTTTRTTTTTTTRAPTTTTHATTTTTTTPTTTTTTAGAAGGTVDPSTVAPGGGFTISSTGWMPSSQVSVGLEPQAAAASVTTTTVAGARAAAVTGEQAAATATPLGALTASSGGAVQGQFTLPAGTAPGTYVVVLTGQGPDSSARTVQLTLTVSTNPSGTGTTATTAAIGVASPASGASGTSGTSAGSPSLAFSGSSTRDLVSFALLFIAAGLFLLSRQARRKAAGAR